MPQPRAQQIKDQKTKVSASTLSSLIVPTGPTQVISGADYTNLVNSTVTKVVGGLEKDSPGFIAGTMGPFAVSAGQTMNIILPGVNGGLQMTITFILADLVSVGGPLVLTADSAASKINATLAGFGVTVPVVSGSLGFLRFTSANTIGFTYGAAASIQLLDGTPGILTSLGLGAIATITAIGQTGPIRGIVTNAQDERGGLALLRISDNESLLTRTAALLNYGSFIYTPDVVSSQVIFSRLTQNPVGPSFLFSFFRRGNLRPQITTSTPAATVIPSRFTDLNAGDTITLTLNDPDLIVAPVVVTTTFVAGPGLTPAQVIAQLNTAWFTATSGSGCGAARGTVLSSIPGPYAFQTGDDFYINFQGNPNIHIQLNTTIVTVAQVVTAINNAIVLAGQAANGQAVATTINGITYVEIRSLVLDGLTSSVGILPGDPTFSNMLGLNKLGCTPGLYKGSPIAEPSGDTEIRLSNPSRGSNATLGITGTVSCLTKMGLPTAGATLIVTPGEEPVTPIGTPIEVLVPEIMEFGEVPVDYDTQTINEITPDPNAPSNAQNGLQGIGYPILLGKDGKIDPSFLRSVVPFLALDQIALGTRLIGSAIDQVKPRMQTPYNTASAYMLVWQSTEGAGSATFPIVRLYVKDGGIYITTNAYIDPAALANWNKDNVAQESSLVFFNKGRTYIKYKASGTPSWLDASGWNVPIQLDESGTAGGATAIATLGANMVSGADALLPRLEIPPAGDNTTYVLVWESVTPGLPGHRIYSLPQTPYQIAGAGEGGMIITVNALQLGGGTWQKDLTGVEAQAVYIGGSQIQVQFRLAANNTNWTTWDNIPLVVDAVTAETRAQSQLIVGASRLGNLADSNLARIIPKIAPPGINVRTLVQEIDSNSIVLGGNIRIYFNTTGILEFTYNARWDGSNWQKDISDISLRYSFGSNPSNAAVILQQRTTLAGPWNDTVGAAGWDIAQINQQPFASGTANRILQSIANGYMSFVGTNKNAGQTTADVNMPVIANSLFANTIIKHFVYVFSFGFAPYSYAIADGFNVASISAVVAPANGNDFIDVNLSAAMADGNYLILVNSFNNTVSKAVVGSTAASSYRVFFYRTDTNAGLLNGNSANDFMAMIVGRQ